MSHDYILAAAPLSELIAPSPNLPRKISAEAARLRDDAWKRAQGIWRNPGEKGTLDLPRLREALDIGKSMRAIEPVAHTAALMRAFGRTDAGPDMGVLASDFVNLLIPMTPDKNPSLGDMTEWRDAMTLADTPLKIFDLIQTRQVTGKHGTMLQTLYPDLYQDVLQAFVDAMIEAPAEEIPRNLRIALSIMTASPVINVETLRMYAEGNNERAAQAVKTAPAPNVSKSENE